MNTVKAFSKQLFGANYESAIKSLAAAFLLFFAVYAAQLNLSVAPFILYLTSTFFTSGIMWQMLNGRRQAELLQGMFLLPFEQHNFVFSYVMAIGAHTLITKTLPVWSLFIAAAPWNGLEIATAFLCGCTACAVTSAAFLMLRKGNAIFPALWAAGILAVILLIRQTVAVLTAGLASMMGAVLYLYFSDACLFCHAALSKSPVQHTGRNGNIFVYLVRYLTENKNYCINTAGLCAAACFLPLLLKEFQKLPILPFGFAVLCLNTPLCTLLSADPDLEQAIRVLPGQAGRFFRKYCIFLFAVNGFVAAVYLCSWQFINGGICLSDIGTGILFALQSAILSVILEWKYPLSGWKTESDLWHHPRKYLVPLLMLLIAALIGTWPQALLIWSVVLPAECATFRRAFLHKGSFRRKD